MSLDESQHIWNEYFERKKAERLREAVALDRSMRNAGLTSEVIVTVDFVHFGSSCENVKALAEQLSENYTVDVVQHSEQEYWFAQCTSRPHGICLREDQHLAWVEFMVEVARSYACVFSTWSFEAPSMERSFSSEHVDGRT